MNDDDEVYSFVVPWSGEIAGGLAAPPAPPPEIPSPEVTQIPTPGPQVDYGVTNVPPGWPDVWNYVKTKSKSVVDQTAFQAISDLQSTVAISEAYTGNMLVALSGQINTLSDLVHSTYDQMDTSVLQTQITMLKNDILLLEDVATALQRIQDTRTIISDVVQPEIEQLRETIFNLQTEIQLQVETWALQNIYQPLEADLQRSITATNTFFGNAVDNLDQRVTQLEKVAVPGLLTGIATLTGAVNMIKTWVDDCGQPMCDTQGPNSKLGQLLKKLADLLGLAAGAALTGVTLADLERFGQTLASLSANDLDGFMSAFVQEGETIGTAGETLLGDIAHLGGEVLADLGIG